MSKVLKEVALPDYVHPEALTPPTWDGTPRWYPFGIHGVYILRIPPSFQLSMQLLLDARPGVSIDEEVSGAVPVAGSLIIVTQGNIEEVPTCSAYQIVEWFPGGSDYVV